MPLAEIPKTPWTPEEIFDHAISSVSDDNRWLVQSQSPNAMTLRREKGVPIWKLLLVGFVTIITFGLGLILCLMSLPDLKNQQIAISARTTESVTTGRITYTKGARNRVNDLLQMIPRSSQTG